MSCVALDCAVILKEFPQVPAGYLLGADFADLYNLFTNSFWIERSALTGHLCNGIDERTVL